MANFQTASNNSQNQQLWQEKLGDLLRIHQSFTHQLLLASVKGCAFFLG